jgi:hypothetical protein
MIRVRCDFDWGSRRSESARSISKPSRAAMPCGRFFHRGAGGSREPVGGRTALPARYPIPTFGGKGRDRRGHWWNGIEARATGSRDERMGDSTQTSQGWPWPGHPHEDVPVSPPLPGVRGVHGVRGGRATAPGCRSGRASSPCPRLSRNPSRTGLLRRCLHRLRRRSGAAHSTRTPDRSASR